MVHKIALKTGMVDGKMVYLDAKGRVNPVLRANLGDTGPADSAVYQPLSGGSADH